MADLEEVLKGREPVVIEIAIGEGEDREVTERLIGEGFVVEGGLAYLDIGWPLPGHAGGAAHMVEGKITGDGPWQIGPHEVRFLVPAEPLNTEWQDWESFRDTAEGRRVASRAAARAALAREGLI